MHTGLILGMLVLAWGLRWGLIWRRGASDTDPWSERWQLTLQRFLLPPLLLMMTAIATLWMGTEGTMLGVPVGWIGYSVAIASLAWAGISLVWRGIQAGRSLRHLRTCAQITVQGHSAYQIEDASEVTPPFAAQVGLWTSHLVISPRLLTALSAEQISAVLHHEQAHAHYRDPFWFFWLGWIRSLMPWLPQTEVLWQELLLLRELRADRWATQRVDSLVLAEALLTVVQAATLPPPHRSPDYCAAFGAIAPPQRLAERIEALLVSTSDPIIPSPPQSWRWLLWAIVPLGLVLLHS
jgi:Zn-dependent protease with chaperone function